MSLFSLFLGHTSCCTAYLLYEYYMNVSLNYNIHQYLKCSLLSKVVLTMGVLEIQPEQSNVFNNAFALTGLICCPLKIRDRPETWHCYC